MALNWDTLPGNTAAYVADIEDTMELINEQMDGDGDEDYDENDLAADLRAITGAATSALREMGKR